MREMRQAIFDGTFPSYYQMKRPCLLMSDEENPSVPPKRNRVKVHTLGDYEVHHSQEGFASIKQISSGEIMHSVNKPEEESNRVYIQQSDLFKKLKLTDNEGKKDIVLWDVGLGAGHNALGNGGNQRLHL